MRHLLKSTIKKNWRSQNLRFSKFKKFFSMSFFWELQLTQISLNFKTSCCNLNAKVLGAKLCHGSNWPIQYSKLHIVFDMFQTKNSTSSTFSRTINPYVPKKNCEVFEINKATTKITTKTWLANVAAIFNHRISLVHRIKILGFCNSKIKKSIFLVSIVLLMFWFLLSICMFELLTFFALLRTTGTTHDILLKEKNQTNAKREIIPYLFV